MFRFGLLATISVAASLLMVGVGMIVALLPQRILELSGSLQDVGYLASAFALSYLVLQLPVGALSDRFGIKSFLILGYLLCTVSGMVFYVSTTPQSIYLGRFVQGAGEAPVWALGPAVLSLAYPNAKGKAIGIYNAAIHVGLSVGPLMGMYIVVQGSKNFPFLIFAALCFSGALIVAVYLPGLQKVNVVLAQQAPSLKGVGALLKQRGLRLALSGILLYGAGYGIFISVLPATLIQDKGFDDTSIGWFFTLFYIAISLSQLIVGPLSDRQGRKNYMVTGLVMVTLGFASFENTQGVWAYMPLGIASFGLGIFCVSSLAYLNECVPASLRSTVSGCYYLFWGGGYFLGPLLLGTQAGAGYLVFALLTALLAFFLWRSGDVDSPAFD